MTTVYGIKNCDSVKKAQQYLTQRDQAFTFHDFRTDGLDETLVRCFLDQLGLDKVINKRSTTFRNLPSEIKENLTEQVMFDAVLAQPTLLKRPVLIHKNILSVGFKEQQYQELFFNE